MQQVLRFKSFCLVQIFFKQNYTFYQVCLKGKTISVACGAAFFFFPQDLPGQ